MAGPLYKKILIKSFKGGVFRQQEDEVVVESYLTIVLNGVEILTLQMTPHLEKELATGFLVGEGFIEKYQDVREFRLTADRRVIEIITREGKPPDLTRMGRRVLASGCGRGFSHLGIKQRERIQELSPGPEYEAELFPRLMEGLEKAGNIFSLTGGTHAAAVADARQGIIFACEDIGRHNAVDKVLGWVHQQGMAFKDKILICSGRISAEMVGKALVPGVPVILSRSAPTTAGVEQAREFNLTLIGFCRGGRFNLYAGEGRVKF